MYRVVIENTVLTKPLETLERALEIREELLRDYFPGYRESAVYIIDEDGIPVEHIFDKNRKDIRKER